MNIESFLDNRPRERHTARCGGRSHRNIRLHATMTYVVAVSAAASVAWTSSCTPDSLPLALARFGIPESSDKVGQIFSNFI